LKPVEDLMSTPDPNEDRTVIRPFPGVTQPLEKTIAASAPVPEPEHDGSALPVGTRLGEFEITRVLGEGGFGIVYLALDHSLDRRVALKEYMPTALAARTAGAQVSVKSARHRETFEAGMKSFINEAKLLAQFDHPSLVKVYRFWEANGTAYMVMPFYEGMTLKERLRQLNGPPEEAWLMSLLGPLTEALAVIHAEHCYHRDIAPDNIILLSGSGRPLLLDFGAARRVIGDMTQALTVILKPGYAPVEQYAEVPSMKQGPWTDIYALSAVVYFAINGRTPPPAVGRMMSDSYTPLSQTAAGRYSERFLQAIDRGLRVKPEERPQSIAQLRAELGMSPHEPEPQVTRPPAFGDSLPGTAGHSVPPASSVSAASTSARSGRRLKLSIGVGGVGLVAAGAAFMLLMRPAKTPSPPPPPVIAQQTPPPAPASAPALSPTPAPAPAPAAPLAPAAPAKFSVQHEFESIVAAASTEIRVEAEPKRRRLSIAARDQLSFTVTSNRDGYVYVLLEGPDGSLVQFFPNSKASGNRIKVGQRMVLPQASWALDASEPVGSEQFVVLVSETPRDFSGLGRQRELYFLKLPTGDAGAALARGFTGRGSVLAGKPMCDAPGCDAYGAARFEVEVVR
jgi:serine/threonine protein kinase